MRKTEYNKSGTGPLRAPTIRSVPAMVLAKLAFAWVRTFSTPISRATLRAMARMVRAAVPLRFNRLFTERDRIGMVRYPASGARLISANATARPKAEVKPRS